MDSEKIIWSREKTDLLISIYRDHIEEFRNPFKRQKYVWENVAYKMKINGYENVTGTICDRKWRNLKSTFKKIYYDIERTQESKCQWDFYNDLVVLFTKDYRKEMGVERKSRTVQPVLEIDNNLEINKYETLSENEEYLDEYFQETEENIEEELLVENEIEQELEEEYLNEEELEVEGVIEEDSDQKFHIQYSEEVATTCETLNIVKKEETEVPIWFTNFLSRYDADQNDLKTCMNNILEKEKQQMKLMSEIYEKLDKRKCDCECIDYKFLTKKRKRLN